MKFFVHLLLTLSLEFCAMPGTGFAQVFRHFSDKEGAPVTAVWAIAQDREGFMWFGTARGLYRYDTRTFKKYRHDPKDAHSIASDYVVRIYCDSKGRLWMSNMAGLSLYNRETDSFTTFRHNPKNPNSLPAYYGVEGFAEDSENNLWAATMFGLNRIVVEGDSIKVVRELTDTPQKMNCIVADPHNGLWVGTSNGILRFIAGKAEPVGKKPTPDDATSYDIYSAHFGTKGTLWLGTTQGLVKLDTITQKFNRVESVRRNGSFPTINRIVEDRNKKLWLATPVGLAFFDPQTYKVKWHVQDKTNPNSLVDDDQTTAYIDRQKGLWVGSSFQGINYLNTNLPDFSLWPAATGPYLTARTGKSSTGRLWALSNAEISATGPDNTEIFSIRQKLPRGVNYNNAFLDESGVLWYNGDDVSVSGYELKTGKVTRYPLKKIHNSLLSAASRINMIFKDSRGRIWLSGGMLGLIRFDLQSGKFETVSNDIIYSVMEDPQSNLWFAGVRNIHLLESHSSKVSAVKVNGLIKPERRPDVVRITQDDSGRIWAVSQEGLFLYDKKDRNFLPYISDAPELLNYLEDIQTDSRGNLWLSGQNKLICYHPDQKIVKVYDYRDGLPYRALLTRGMSFKDYKGKLYFPTNEGTFRFDPDKITGNRARAPLALTSLKLFNKEVRTGDQTALLEDAIEMTKEITFRHDQNIFTLDFALLNYGRSDMNQYAYLLENFEKDWNYVQSPSATYTNLPPGIYTFLVKAANGDGYWNPEPLRLEITILPPWWKTWYAYLLYILLTATAVYAITRFFWLRSSFRRENALNQVKLDFFTNVSHEIRTHLSLISGPLEKAYEQFKEGKSVETNLNYARNSSDRLMLLVNELLDFRKIQSGSVRLQVREHDVAKIIKSVIASFEHMAKEKNIETSLLYPDRSVLLWFDIAQMQKVFYNLLSNAYKFAPEGGKVSVCITETSNEVNITVKDSGKGISEEHLRKLFTFYYQADSEKPGYGIGLALSKSIIEQHKGQLTAESKLATEPLPGEASRGGTTLMIRMLRKNSHFLPDQIAAGSGDYVGNMLAETIATTASSSIEHSMQSNTILIIEDNDQLRVFIRELFEGEFKTLEAENGLRGLELAGEHLPDIILSDVMMPGMNGLEVCSRLKSNTATSHIPVVLLTARTQNEQIIEGLSLGADDYLVKPFDPRILELKVSNLIRQRDELKQRYRQLITLDQQALGNIAQDMNEAFINKLSVLVIENISDPNFGVHELAMQVGMSVSALYKKLKSLTGMTVNEFMKTIRFNEAKKLLKSGVYNVSEVSTIVGFEDSRHFSKEFRKIFGKNPNEIKRQV